MPSTARITVASKDSNSYVVTNLDDVVNTPGGRGRVIDLLPSILQAVSWPSTGESQVYIRAQRTTSSYTIKIDNGPSTGLVFIIPQGTGPFFLVLGEPSPTPLNITATVATSLTLFFF